MSSGAILDNEPIRYLSSLLGNPRRVPFLAPLLRVVRAQATVDQARHLRRMNFTAAARCNRIVELADELLAAGAAL